MVTNSQLIEVNVLGARTFKRKIYHQNPYNTKTTTLPAIITLLNYELIYNSERSYSKIYICNYLLALSTNQESAKYKKEELIHQYKENVVTTTYIFKIQP